jgi:hypothetical protein
LLRECDSLLVSCRLGSVVSDQVRSGLGWAGSTEGSTEEGSLFPLCSARVRSVWGPAESCLRRKDGPRLIKASHAQTRLMASKLEAVSKSSKADGGGGFARGVADEVRTLGSLRVSRVVGGWMDRRCGIGGLVGKGSRLRSKGVEVVRGSPRPRLSCWVTSRLGMNAGPGAGATSSTM